jgi:hypothetical protein
MREIDAPNQIEAEKIIASEARGRFMSDFLRPHFPDDVRGSLDFRALANQISGRTVRKLFTEAINVEVDDSRREVNSYMIDTKTKEIFNRVGSVLAGFSGIKNTVILPETEDELTCLVSQIFKASKSGDPINIVTPVCPDWSRDSQGRYDFKSLGGGESFIANKFFVNAPEILSVLHTNEVPYRGLILLADWGLETEIDATDTYGQKLTPADIDLCFMSTLSATDQTLKHLQEDPKLGPLFANYEVVSMKSFLKERINEVETMESMRRFFSTDKQGLRLLNLLARFYVKGKDSVESGVNIL